MTTNMSERIPYRVIHEAMGQILIVGAYSGPQNFKCHRSYSFLSI
jgi:hypothetical protein